MKNNTLFIKIKKWLHRNSNGSVDAAFIEPPLPVELFSVDQMERYGKKLAKSHLLTQQSSADILLSRLESSKDTLIKACRILTSTTTAIHRVTPAGEWLLDNFYLIEEHIRTTKRHLPKGYGRGLPQLAGSFSLGYPRVYDIALQIIEHSDGRWDLENLTRFVSSYQSVTTLTLGELWAIPIMLRLALIENLSHVSARIAANWRNHNLADSWADRMIDVAASDPKKLVLIIADMARSNPPISGAFVAELARRLQGAALALPLTWIEQHLAEEGLTIEQLVEVENKQQAANQISISNSIASLRRLNEIDWRKFVETMSAVNHVLLMDPTHTYGHMDYDTRDRYCHVIERLARDTARSEVEVATLVIELAKTAANRATPVDSTDPHVTRRTHVGFYLIGAGLQQLEQALALRFSLWTRLRRSAGKLPILSYLGVIALITIGLTGYLLFKANQGEIGIGWLILLGLTFILSISQMAVSLVNWAATLLVKPHPLPRMNFTQGIPSQYRTIVVVPAMLESVSAIQSLVEALEVRFLGNRDNNLHFALLTDFNDAKQQHTPEDAGLLSVAKDSISALNERYPSENGDIFFLFHRPRRWNAREQRWMGYERKRGKLSDLNELLRGITQQHFSVIIGRTAVLAKVKYVITLDSDTELPRESARQIVGAMAHPLNQPHYDAMSQRVIEGYGILQLRLAQALSTHGSTRYVEICGGESGIDPYTRTVSDIYQDLFGEGSFSGKGIYDVDMFQQVLQQRFPENRILSHDLLEGCYLRSGYLSDVPLYEKSVRNYLADVKRRTRWIRGDWQLMSWLLPRVLNKNGSYSINPLSVLSKWKLLDNLRRSLVPIALLLLLGLGWTVLPATHFWFGAIVAILLLPAVMALLLELVRKPVDRLASQHLLVITQVIRRRLQQLILYFIFLPHEAWYSLVAIIRTCWRVMVSHRHLLEWTPSDQEEKSLCDAWTQWIKNLWLGPIIAIGFGVFLWINRPWCWLIATPLLMLWLISPLIARWLSQPFKPGVPKLDTKQIRFLHVLSRKTWAFFETFITAEDNWLPPDNYQEEPVEILAHRTSPTNIGLSLLANLTAYDFGYITTTQLLTRTSNTLQTMARLEQYRGHLYNWYNTQTLEPLQPRYVSTVDSGNLAGHLLTLRQGLLALPQDPLLNVRYLDGLHDTLDVLVHTLAQSLPPEVEHFRQLLSAARLSFTATVTDALASSDDLCAAADEMAKLWPEYASSSAVSHEWSQRLLLQCRAIRDELKLIVRGAEQE